MTSSLRSYHNGIAWSWSFGIKQITQVYWKRIKTHNNIFISSNIIAALLLFILAILKYFSILNKVFQERTIKPNLHKNCTKNPETLHRNFIQH